MAVLTEEERYAQRFCAFVNQKSDLVFTAVPFSSVEELQSFRNRHGVDLLLADSCFVLTGECLGGDGSSLASRTFMFSENGVDSYGSESDIFGSIQKYQTADAIVRALINHCEDMNLMKGTVSSGRRVRLISVYSPTESPGRMEFALTLSRSLSSKHKTLYLNFDEFSGMRFITGYDPDVSMADAVYYMKQGMLNEEKLASMIFHAGEVDYIPPFRFAEDLNAIEAEDLAELIGRIAAVSSYEVIVADVSSFSRESQILDLSDVIYMPVQPDSLSRERVEEFIDYLGLSGRQKMADRLVAVELPGSIPLNDRRTYIDTLLYGAMGDLIRSLGEV